MAYNEIVEAMQTMKSRKATRPFEVDVMIVASGEIGVKGMTKL